LSDEARVHPIFAYLLGEAPHPSTGQWFERPENSGAYWWRRDLRTAIAALSPTRAEEGE
jgi:hypothetical protein